MFLQAREWVNRAALAPTMVLAIVLAASFSYIGNGINFLPPLANPAKLAGFASVGLVLLIMLRFGLRYLRNLESLGLTDSLSQLPNRRALHLDIKKVTDGEIAVALIDLDGFKAVNDHYGHMVGDRLIIKYAQLLKEVCGNQVGIYRLGGDEFALVLSGPLAGNLLEGICRKLLLLLTKPLHVDDRAIAFGASIGLTRCVDAGNADSSELLRQADIAMYVSKAAGKMRCTWYSEEFDQNREQQHNLENELRDALENGEFQIFYQPLVDANQKNIVAVEALIRWIRPDGNVTDPGVFIPIAEQSGLINSIGLWVLRKAIEDSRDWGDIKVSVNISAMQLRNPEFPIELGNLLEDYQFPASRLELEVTETQLVVDSEMASRSLDLIRSFGVSVALDDFGTGYASIGFLRQCQFEKLKLDRTLITDAITSESTKAMMMASVTLARSLNMAITAEGVETEEQATLAREAGCDQIQGWLYYKAMPAENLRALLKPQDKAKTRKSNSRAKARASATAQRESY